MSSVNQLMILSLQNVKQTLINPLSGVCVRHASKKAGTSTKNSPKYPQPKHRGWKVQDGHVVTAGTSVVTQMTTRFHPGLHVGLGKNGTLFAMEAGKVLITCEKVNLNWDHTWVQRCYSGRQGQVIYKKHFNILPEKQHDRFKLIDLV